MGRVCLEKDNKFLCGPPENPEDVEVVDGDDVVEGGDDDDDD